MDIDKIAKELGLDKLAIEAAASELPRTDTTSPDDKERKIHTYIYNKLTDLTSLANKKLVQYNTAISDTDLNQQRARINNITEHTSLKIKTLISTEKDKLVGMQNDKIKFNNELEVYPVK